MSTLAVLPSIAGRGRPLADVSPGEVIAAVVVAVVAVNLAIVALLGWVWWRDTRATRRSPNGIISAQERSEKNWS